jgi:exonuclease III
MTLATATQDNITHYIQGINNPSNGSCLPRLTVTGLDRPQPTPQDMPNCRKKTKVTLKIASLNMRGRGEDKWHCINQLIRDKKIGILALQETHLTEQLVDSLEALYHKRIKIFHTCDQNTNNAKGVALVLNKELTNTHNIVVHELIPGRAIYLEYIWHADHTLRILAIYAPNSPTENQAFWQDLLQKWTIHNLTRPDLLLGDFNLVEDAIEQLSCHLDHEGTTEALQDLKSNLHLVDSWRRTNPASKAFTYQQKATGSQLRIDRIYVTEDVLKHSYDWKIEPAGLPTDHKLISTLIASPILGEADG